MIQHPLQIARRLLNLGLSVIPVPPPVAGVLPGQPGDGKVPTLAWRPYQTRLPTPQEIDAWFVGNLPINLAVITGAVSGIVVIDADDLDARRWCVRRLPYTPWQTKTSRGFHLWYRHPGRFVANRARIETSEGRLKIDVRGDGGYVIAPGSVHATGAEYVEAGDWNEPRERVPVFWPGWLARPVRAQRSIDPARPRATGDILARARAYLERIQRPEIGQGSDAVTLYAACRLVRGFGLAPGEAAALLWGWAGNRPGWTPEWVAEKVAHAERYGTEAIGALR